MRTKLFVYILCLILIAGIFVGCGTATSVQGSESNSAYPENMGFELVYESYRTMFGDEPYYAYYRDRITDVMYVWVSTGDVGSTSNLRMAGGFSVMLDPNTGGPLTYEAWLELTDGGQPQLSISHQG